MADEVVPASEKSSLSAFDKLKLSTNNNYSINRSNIVTRYSIDKNAQSVVEKVTSTASVSAENSQTSNPNCSVYEKSIDSQFPQVECSNNNNKTVMVFGANEKNTTFASGSVSVYGKTRASGCSLFPPSIVPKKNDKTMQISCDATDKSDSVIPPSPLTSSFSSQSLGVSSSSSNSLPSIEMVLPNNGAGSFEMFSSPCSSLSSPANPQMVQNKVNNQFDSNEVSIKMFKSGKCKNSVSSSSSSSQPIVAASANSSSPIQIKTKCSSNICAPPPKVPPYNNKVGSNKRSNTKSKNQNFGLPLLPARLTKAAAAVTRQNSSNMDNNKSAETTDERNKKKRCSDRYDSSESSDSGVATSLSCTDSSTASSDVSDPGSPYSPVLLGDDLHHKNSTMPPQTILATTNGNAGKSPTTSAATPVQNVLKGSKQQQKQSQNKNQLQPKHTKTQLTTSSPLQKISQHIWPWTTLGGVGAGGNFSSEMASSPKTNAVALSNSTKNTNKRHSQTSSTPSDGGAKKTRTTNGSSKDNNASNVAGGGVNVNGIALQPPQSASNNKRLKAAAMEESQTKITGYFKSQMKAQIHQSGLKKDTLPHILPSPSSSSSIMSTLSPSVTVTAVTSSAPSMSSNSTVPSVKTTSSSLNKYFSLLSTQMREEQERAAANASSNNSNNSNASNLPSLPPALKKIERSKPTKIAQVAPNLRKTTAAPPLSHITEKSPKKHVAIAPRTADTRQRHEPLSVPSPLKAPTTPTQQQQPAVLLTAIHIPQSNQPPQLVPTSPRQQVSVGKTQQTNVNVNVSPTSKIPTGPSLYQIPMMPNLVQFPNLIATNVSQLTGARGNHHHHQATTAQYFLNGTVFKLQQFTPPSPTNASSPAFSLDNGNQSINTTTVTNNTAIAIEQHHASNNKNTSSITATSLQEMLSNQFQTQQQQQQQQQQSVSAHNHRLHHSQPVFMATTTGLLLNATSLPAMLASSGKQTMAIQPQQIPALQPIQGASAIMPGLSSIFSPHQEQQIQQYKSEQVAAPLDSQIPPLQQTHIPPLSVSSSAFSKLAIVKAGNAAFTPSVHQVSATQPPPLVTISSGSPIVSDGDAKPLISAKPYQQTSGQQENIVTKSKRVVSDNTKKSWQDATQPILLAPMPPKSPPALIYPSLMSSKEEQHKTEDIFDLLKNSKNETTLSPPFSTQYPTTEEKSQEQEPELEEEEGSSSPHTLSIESSSLLSPETTSNTIISEESIKDSSPLEYSLASSSLILSESPKLEIDEKSDKTQTPVVTITETSSSDTASLTLSPTVDIALADNDTLPKCAISPILSQPKTIRFPAKHESGHRFGPKGMRRHDGVCYWDKCNKKHESNSKLLDHMQTHHVNTQTGPFACLWLGCKVYGRESCSRRWLERHVLSHGGTKPFKCIVDGCGLRFGSQLALQKHVNGHFTATESKDSTSKRTSDPPVPKLLRKNGKKLRYRRQPFSARMFDFFDAGIMEGLNHRLRQISTLTNGKNCVTFRGDVMMRRKNLKGVVECYVQWAPPEIISNEWLPESNEPYIKTLPINRMQPKEKTNVESLLRSAYRLPHSPNLFQSFHSLSRQNSQDSSSTNNIYPDHSQSSTPTTEYPTDETSRSSSFGNSSLGSISNLPLKFPQIELRQKQSRKQPKRIQPS